VFVKGLTKGGYDDFYGIIHKIYELEYNTCEWFDPSREGTKA